MMIRLASDLFMCIECCYTYVSFVQGFDRLKREGSESLKLGCLNFREGVGGTHCLEQVGPYPKLLRAGGFHNSAIQIL